MAAPKPYNYWLKAAARTAVPSTNEWGPLVESGREFALDLWQLVAVTLLRLLVLVTLPISAPLLALWMARENRKVVERNEQAAQMALNSLRSLQKGGQHGTESST